LAFVILIFLGYLFAPLLDRLYYLIKFPFRFSKQFLQRLTRISLTQLKLEEIPEGVSRRRYFANISIQSLLLALGLFFIACGFWTVQMAIGVDLVSGLEAILVYSASFIVGFQIISLSLSFALYSELRLIHLNRNLREFAMVTAAILWIFGIWTYFLSWLIDAPIERQSVVLASTFISIWAGSLLLNQTNRTRIMTDFMLLGGLAGSLSVWLFLDNPLVILLGGIGFCSVLVHLLITCVHSADNSYISHPTYKLDSTFAERDIETTQ
jgi:hypothetical protein